MSRPTNEEIGLALSILYRLAESEGGMLGLVTPSRSGGVFVTFGREVVQECEAVLDKHADGQPRRAVLGGDQAPGKPEDIK